MSSILFDLALLWEPQQTDKEYPELLTLIKTDFSNVFDLHLFTTTQSAIQYIQSRGKSPRLLIVITKLGMTDETAAQPLIETIRQLDKHTFIILHSHKTCADANLR